MTEMDSGWWFYWFSYAPKVEMLLPNFTPCWCELFTCAFDRIYLASMANVKLHQFKEFVVFL